MPSQLAWQGVLIFPRLKRLSSFCFSIFTASPLLDIGGRAGVLWQSAKKQGYRFSPRDSLFCLSHCGGLAITRSKPNPEQRTPWTLELDQVNKHPFRTGMHKAVASPGTAGFCQPGGGKVPTMASECTEDANYRLFSFVVCSALCYRQS